MTERANDLPVFPTTAPDDFRDVDVTVARFDAVFDRLAAVVDVPHEQLDGPTPCASFTVADLRRHVLAWLQFFAAALNDPTGSTTRIDTDTWDLPPSDDPAGIVRAAAGDIAAAVHAGVVDGLVVMSQARMAGDGVLAMALGEYLVHGWDLAVATGRDTTAQQALDDAAVPALAFLRTMVAPEYRGPDSGFFDAEVPAPPGASPLVRLLCFAGRDPDWAP